MNKKLKPSLQTLQIVIDKKILIAAGAVVAMIALAIIAARKGWLPGLPGGSDQQEEVGETIDLSNATQVVAIKVGQLDTGDTVLTDQNGMTLYVNITEDEFKSTCYDECADKWHPLIIESGEQVAGPKFSVIVRDDDTMQAAFAGYPLYTYYKDQKKGDYLGDLVDGIWSAAKMQLAEKGNPESTQSGEVPPLPAGTDLNALPDQTSQLPADIPPVPNGSGTGNEDLSL